MQSRFQFTLRTALLIMFVALVAAGLFSNVRRSILIEEKVAVSVRKANGDLAFMPSLVVCSLSASDTSGRPEMKGHIQTITLDRFDDLQGHNLKLWQHLPQLNSVEINSTFFSDDHLQHIMACRHIQSVELNETLVSEAGLAMAVRMESLENLVVRGACLTKEVFFAIPSDSRLATWDIDTNREALCALLTSTSASRIHSLQLRLIDPGSAPATPLDFTRCRALEEFSIEGALHQSDIYRLCETLYSPKRLRFRSCPIRGDLIAPLATSSSLRSLALERCSIDEAAVHVIRNLRQLEALSFDGSSVTSEQLRQLSGLQIWRLNLARTNIDDSVIDVIARMPSLQHLNLTGTKVSSAGLAILRRRQGMSVRHDY